ncbi:MAG: nucleotide pyrophosphohydrolase [Candidatus Babeliales bacterium]
MRTKKERIAHTASDKTSTLETLKAATRQVFTVERDWNQFHSPKNLSMNIATEAAELMEHFLWCTTEQSRELVHDAKTRTAIAHELADVLIGVIQFANQAELDLASIFSEKLALIEQKYPADKARGKSNKYTDYQ